MLSSWVMAFPWLVSLRTFSIAQDSALEEVWRDWKRTYGKVYSEEEEPFRRVTWEKNLQLIEQHNREAVEGKQTYWMSMNQFGDLTNEELNRTMGSFHPDSVDPHNASEDFSQAPAIQQMPKPVKRRHRHYGTSRKDQLALAYTRKLGKQRSENFAKLCLISSNGTKKLLGRRCGCISRYRRRCQKCCKLA
ncbi:cathepsin L1-like isoform X2 [Python bivittatus]|nr:cathepsin L1-like isoform X2 [Python bivittatus]XP_007434448.1 cathepsin L1-like isoform X2 [Python bivittatus]XP_025026398.1 cathepsin L1-like isoform X2 [Python bivittatus]XP_025026399.1 cathepsin L1-like isoform X2 [Python bivittatus]XP_025026400.1 cathepsin L1-like isoform X2 [Python bivittatus]XP_025026401.1 cathepsin L1-like isoform X2 [Python bivittatus]